MSYDFAASYGALVDSERLQVSRDEMSWLQAYAAPAQPADVLVGFGCADPNPAVEVARPNWESWGLDEGRARELAQRRFMPAYAVNLPMCSCLANRGCGPAERPSNCTPLVELARS
jgi:hypothetical protein